MLALEPLCEPTAATDAYRNYCLWPYQPIAPTAGAWRPVNLLRNSFQAADAHPNHLEIVDALVRSLGRGRTVWGVKWDGARLGWEYYFYDYERRERTVSLTRVLRALAPWISTDLSINESLPYFMFSLDMSDDVVAGSAPLDRAHVYVGHPGGLLSAGISYRLDRAGMTMENLYSFFDAKEQLDEAADKAFCSVHVDATTLDPDLIFLPEVRNCRSICVANKPTHDTIYFSGVTTDQLLFFLERFAYPRAIVEYVAARRERFRPLLHDVGFDYVQVGSTIRALKSGYYGVF